jgi:hypothetical protein
MGRPLVAAVGESSAGRVGAMSELSSGALVVLVAGSVLPLIGAAGRASAATGARPRLVAATDSTDS